MKEVIKKEFINRYSFIYENSDYILLPRILISSENGYKVNIDKNFLVSLELFLLSDIPCELTNIYGITNALKNNNSFVKKCEKTREIIDDLNEYFFNSYDKRKYYDKCDVKKVFQILRNYILGQNEIYNKEKKLKALDEYFRFNRYNNSETIYRGGAILGYEDLGIFCEKLVNRDSPYRRYKRSYLIDGDFIDYVSDNNNHYENNNSIFTEDEKQEVYLKLHPGEVAWNKKKILKNN